MNAYQVLSRKDFGDDFAMDVGETAIGAVMAKGEFFVIDSQEVEDGCVEIVAIGPAGGCFPRPFVALAVSNPPFDACAGEP